MTTIPFTTEIWTMIALGELLIIALLLFLRRKGEKPVDMRRVGDLPARKTEPGMSGTGRIEDLHGDAIYGTADRYDKDDYLGRVSRGAEIELVDRKVQTNEFDLPIIKIRVISNEWHDEIGKIGWVGLASTSFRLFYDPDKKTMLDREFPPPKRP